MEDEKVVEFLIPVAYGLATLTHAVANQPGIDVDKLKQDIETMLDGLISEQPKPHMQQVMHHVKQLMLNAASPRDDQC